MVKPPRVTANVPCQMQWLGFEGMTTSPTTTDIETVRIDRNLRERDRIPAAVIVSRSD